jgi:hypothetical protein
LLKLIAIVSLFAEIECFYNELQVSYEITRHFQE